MPNETYIKQAAFRRVSADLEEPGRSEAVMPRRGELLVAIVNNLRDFRIARDKNWYRIPVSSARKWLSDCWPPLWLAFYQTKVFGQEAHSIRYHARILDIREVFRWELFPDRMPEKKSGWRYYQLILEPLQQLPQPILSRRFRRIVFIPTTWNKFVNGVEVNDLYHGSPLEDRLWAALKRRGIQAEREEFVEVKQQAYALDFAIYCAKGNIDVETDGDTWHANPKKAAKDNRRENALESVGWSVLRFSTHQVREELEKYCLPTVADTINSLGGLDEGGLIRRKIDLSLPEGTRQLSLFDDL